MEMFRTLTIVTVGMIMIWIVAFMAMPAPLAFNQGDVVFWLKEDIKVHERFMAQDPVEHQMWINNFTQVINYVNGGSSPLTRTTALDIINLAQSTHAGNVNTNYYVMKWHYEWFKRYEKIKDFIKNQRR